MSPKAAVGQVSGSAALGGLPCTSEGQLAVDGLCQADSDLLCIPLTSLQHRQRGVLSWQWQEPRKNKPNCSGEQGGVPVCFPNLCLQSCLLIPIGQSQAHGDP